MFEKLRVVFTIPELRQKILLTLPSPVQMMAIAERNQWSGYESIASWYVWRSLE